MEKVCLALWRRPEAPVDDLGQWGFSTLVPHLRESSDVRAATVHLESDKHGSLRFGAGRDGDLLTALVSVWLDSYQDSGELHDLVGQAPACASAAYLVCESVPTPYGAVKTWTDGHPSPGLSLVTMLDKPGNVEESDFYRDWHVLHRQTTAECHPFSSYVRNEVARPLTSGAPRYRGIVTESAVDEQDMLDQHRFYVSGGDPDRLRENQKRVWSETRLFIDYDTIQVAPMSEHILRRLAPTSP